MEIINENTNKIPNNIFDILIIAIHTISITKLLIIVDILGFVSDDEPKIQIYLSCRTFLICFLLYQNLDIANGDILFYNTNKIYLCSRLIK